MSRHCTDPECEWCASRDKLHGNQKRWKPWRSEEERLTMEERVWQFEQLMLDCAEVDGPAGYYPEAPAFGVQIKL
jgi:hypothetical protein